MKIKIGNLTYEVLPTDYIDFGEGRNFNGALDRTYQVIYLVKDLHHQTRQEVLFHEITHALIDNASLSDLIKNGREEEFVTRFGKSLTQFVLENDMRRILKLDLCDEMEGEDDGVFD